MTSTQSYRLRSEFAMVEITITDDPYRTSDGNDRYSVTVKDLENGMAINLDVLELESLTRMKHEDFGPLIVDHYPPPPGFEEE